MLYGTVRKYERLDIFKGASQDVPLPDAGRKANRGASSSELKRWLQNGAVLANGEKLAWDEEMGFPIFSFVLSPKHPVTLW